jgi:hypothetical protein
LASPQIEAQPAIKSFMPKLAPNEKTATVELLRSHVEGFDVAGAIELYEMLKRKKAAIDLATKQQLLELIWCPFYESSFSAGSFSDKFLFTNFEQNYIKIYRIKIYPTFMDTNILFAGIIHTS